MNHPSKCKHPELWSRANQGPVIVYPDGSIEMYNLDTWTHYKSGWRPWWKAVRLMHEYYTFEAEIK